MRLKITVSRFLAYLIDISIVLIICGILSAIIPSNIDNLNHSLNVTNENVLNGSITIHEYIDQFIKINYEIDKINIVSTAINIMLIIIYFIIVPILTKGYTIGLYLMKIKISGNINFKNLFIRNIFTTGLLHMIINVILIHTLSYKYYFIDMTILSFVQLLLVIISTFMIIYKKDKLGLQDIFSKTHIEKVI